MTLGTNVPTPAFTNLPIQSQFFAPSYFQISNIQFGNETQVTVLPNFGRNCNFVVGQQILFIIPNAYGTYQLNGKKGIVLSIIDSLNFLVNISTSEGYTPFVAVPANTRQIAQVVPAGTFDTGNINPNPADVGLTIPGSFTNTQPFVV